MSLTTPLQDHHHRCDALFEQAEQAAGRADWPACSDAFRQFAAQMETHFRTEEEVLFPAFEAATGAAGGPTGVMRMEHGQMRALLAQMDVTLAARDAEGFGGCAETLLILMQQHNMKEENILYPMCDRTVEAGLGETLQTRLDAAPEAACPA